MNSNFKKVTKQFGVLAFAALWFNACTPQKEEMKYEEKTATDKHGNTYTYVTNDPLGAKIYTLDNGLKVYLSENPDEPRIQTLIAVRAGSKNDPAETTGLAHYLEHMMFKGTSQIGALDWTQEKPLLDEIKNLYEQHKAATSLEEKKAIYAQIDSVSNLAASFAAANEYDKMVSSIGAKNTNAFTSNDQTVYINDIPSNELEKWAKLEAERFRELVLRLFHTELETVYEEFNMGQDNDGRKTFKALMEALYPTHPYGTQTTIGEGEHLKNPSMINIENFWNTYYRANNMAICLSGDIDAADAFLTIKSNFGALPSNSELPTYTKAELQPIQGVVKREVIGPDAESVNLAFRFDGALSPHRKYLMLLDAVLNNNQAGLIDLNLIQQQKVLQAYSYPSIMTDYSMFMLSGRPKTSQTLEEVESLLLSQLELIKAGNFEDWMMEASVNNMKLREYTKLESNWRAYALKDAFIYGGSYLNEVTLLEEISKITKQELVDFAKQHFNNNYVVVYKRTGKDDEVMKVDKPQITPVPVNRETSAFINDFNQIPSKRLTPTFVDFEKELNKTTLNSGNELFHIAHPSTPLVRLDFIYDAGKNDDNLFELGLNFLPLLGTDSLSPAEVKQAFFRLGFNMDVYPSQNRSYISLMGLQQNAPQAVALIAHLLERVVEPADSAVLNEYINDILKKRTDAKLNKGAIRMALSNYGMYGKNSPFTNVLSNQELNAIEASQLVAEIKKLKEMPHKVLYYGQHSSDEVATWCNTYFGSADASLLPEKRNFEEQSTGAMVYFVNHDMVQTDVVLLAKGPAYNPEVEQMAGLYNEFYGSGLSSIVFQEIREAKGLAYTAYSRLATPTKADKSFYLNSFVGTQSDKLADAINAMTNLLNNMPEANQQFESAREAILKKIESDKLIKDRIFWAYQSNLDKGLNYDLRQATYKTIQEADMEAMKQFFNTYIANQNHTMLVMGNKADVDFKVLEKYGKVVELSKEEIFGY